MKTKNEILHLLSLYKPTAQSKYGLTRLGIFGSVARDEHTEGSDVDVCYEGRVPTLLTLDLIQTDLEKLLESRVDLVRVRDGMNSLLKQRIQKENSQKHLFRSTKIAFLQKFTETSFRVSPPASDYRSCRGLFRGTFCNFVAQNV